MNKFMPPKPTFWFAINIGEDPVISRTAFDSWYDKEIRSLFVKAVEVYGHTDTDGGSFVFYQKHMSPPNAQRTGLVVNIQPIQPDSAESILRELVELMHSTFYIQYKGHYGNAKPDITSVGLAYEKASKFLERKSNG